MALLRLKLYVSKPWWTPIYLLLAILWLTVRLRPVGSLSNADLERLLRPLTRRIRISVTPPRANPVSRWLDRRALDSQIRAHARLWVRAKEDETAWWAKCQGHLLKRKLDRLR